MRRDSTGLKVEIAFGCLVALLIGVSWMGLSRMGQINASSNRVFDERSQKLDAVRQGSYYVNANFRTTLRFFLEAKGSPAELAAYAAQLKANTLKGSSGLLGQG